MRLVSKKLEHTRKGQIFFDELVEREIYFKKFGYLTVFMDENIVKYRNNLIFEDGSPFETTFTK